MVRLSGLFGFVSSMITDTQTIKTPSLTISLYKKYRDFGIGTAMMKEIFALLKSHGRMKKNTSW